MYDFAHGNEDAIEGEWHISMAKQIWCHKNAINLGKQIGSIVVNIPIGSMYGIYANIWGILMVNVTIYSIHGSYGIYYVYI